MVKTLLTGVSRNLFRYETTTADWDAAKYINNVPDVSFARFAAANLHYGSYGELVEGPPLLSISDNKREDCGVGSHYGRYGKLVAGPRPISDGNNYQGAVDKDDWGARDYDGEEEEDDDLGEGDVDESDGDYAVAALLDIPRTAPLVTTGQAPLDTSRKTILDKSEETAAISDAGKVSRLIATFGSVANCNCS